MRKICLLKLSYAATKSDSNAEVDKLRLVLMTSQKAVPLLAVRTGAHVRRYFEISAVKRLLCH